MAGIVVLSTGTRITENSVLKSLAVSSMGNKLVISPRTVSQNAQGIIVIYHECTGNNNSLILSTAYLNFINSFKNDTMVTINVKPGCYHIAIFGVTGGYRVEESAAKVVCINVGGSCKLVALSNFQFDLIIEYRIMTDKNGLLSKGDIPVIVPIIGECLIWFAFNIHNYLYIHTT